MTQTLIENYSRPMVLLHQPIRFETALSCNPGNDTGKVVHPPGQHICKRDPDHFELNPGYPHPGSNKKH